MSPETLHPLAKLAEAYGLEISYEDANGTLRLPTTEVLISALRALGAPLSHESQAETALREKARSDWQRPLEPVTVHWQGSPAEFQLRLPESMIKKMIPAVLRFESGETKRLSLTPSNAPTQSRESVDGTYYYRKRFRLRTDLPPGIHSLLLEMPGRLWKSALISAPPFAFTDPNNSLRRWGLFLPLYALYSKKRWGAGDLGDLERWMEWTRKQGGHVVATLPLFSTYLDQPYDPSPYSPVSRLFYNEFYLNLDKIPGFATCPEALSLVNSPEWEMLRQESHRSRLVDYRQQMTAKRRAIELLAKSFFNQAPDEAFQRFLSEHPQAELYARFRAVTECHQATWPHWPDRLKHGDLRKGDFEENARNYHLYAQWQMEEQLRALATISENTGPRLYLDLPLGIHPEGYDAWHERALFTKGFTVGAPPDHFFSRGQNWGFPPLLPEASRCQGHAYYLETLRRQMAVAGMLRIDHAMGMHRLFWIPRGASPTEGCYIRYPAEELYALLCLESQRSQCLIVGEDLGTVAPELRPTMSRHHLLRSYVAPFEWQDATSTFNRAPKDSVASLNTHDMPTFVGFWEGKDLEERLALGLMDQDSANAEIIRRQDLRESLGVLMKCQEIGGEAASLQELLHAILSHLAAGNASWMMINLEDLWGESLPQNVPGTYLERPNWQRRAAFSLEEIAEREDIRQILRKIHALRP